MALALSAARQTSLAMTALAGLCLGAATNTSPATAATLTNGINIIDFEAGQRTDGLTGIGQGDRLVLFLSGRGTYASVSGSKLGARGCIASLTQPIAADGTLTFGVELSEEMRQLGVHSLCSVFTVKQEGSGFVRIETPKGYSRKHPIDVVIPFAQMDFNAPAFQTAKIKGVKIGPAEPIVASVPLPPIDGNAIVHRPFRQELGRNGPRMSAVDGRIAPKEITQWPWNVLYFGQHHHEFPKPVAFDAYRQAIVDEYGEPSSEQSDRGYMVWLFDMTGTQVTPSPDSDNTCVKTANYWLEYDSVEIVSKVNWDWGHSDLGPWGCLAAMELITNHGAGAVNSYSLRLVSGYVMSLNHFFQRIEHPIALMKAAEELATTQPSIK